MGRIGRGFEGRAPLGEDATRLVRVRVGGRGRLRVGDGVVGIRLRGRGRCRGSCRGVRASRYEARRTARLSSPCITWPGSGLGLGLGRGPG